MYYDIGVDEQDPFVMMAWRCKNLSSFTVLGMYCYIRPTNWERAQLI